MIMFTRRDWAFALKVLASVVLTLGIALWIDLPRPYWAVSTVFITSQPLAGATRSKAAYRVYGTLLGAVASVILVPNLVNAPELLTVAIALWVSVCLYFSLLDRTPKSYVLMLAGYTAAFVGFPEVGDPGSIFDVAVARAEEITLGILCTSLVMSIALPESVAPAIKSRLDQWFRDASALSISALNNIRTPDDQIKRLNLASEAIAFDALATPLRYDMTGAERSVEAMATLRQHMLMFLPISSSIADRLEVLERAQAISGKVRQNLSDMAAWLKSATIEPAAASKIRRAVAEPDPELEPKPKWADLVAASLIVRLKDFIDLRQDARILQHHIVDATPVREALLFRYTARVRTIRHRDPGMALLSAIAAFIAIVLASAAWIATAWPDGSAAPMLAAVGCSLFAAQDDPAPQILGFGYAGLMGIVGAGVYLFAILPMATSFEMLVIALAPAIVICALLMTKPKTALIGLGIGVNGFTLLALQSSYSGDFAAFMNGAIAVMVGLWTAAVVTRLMRSVGGEWSARRLWRTNRDSLVEAALRQGPSDGLELAALMLDRVGLIAPRLAALPREDAEWTTELLTEVRVGLNLVELRRLHPRLPKNQSNALDLLLNALSRHYRSDVIHPPTEVLAMVDICLDLSAIDEENPVRREALLGLTALRRGLFPNAEPYQYGVAAAAQLDLAS
jgi:uncharacterized membrane protein YccC